MDVLIDKSSKYYNYTSRYASFPTYYNTLDDKYMYGLTNNLSQNCEYTIHYVTDSDTYDSLAFKYYGRPDLFWIIADFNRVSDPFEKPYERFNFLYIPSKAGLRWSK